MSDWQVQAFADTVYYQEFLERKVAFDRSYGHDIARSEIHPWLKPHQADIVAWAVKGGRRAIFAAFGLGKSVIQLETLRLTLAKHGGGKALIICPLGVRIEFAADAAKLEIETRFVRRTAELDGDGIYITNYESVRDGRLDVDEFTAVSLDEASVLRSFGSKTYQTFLAGFSRIPYRFVATATPSPNRYKELIHYAGFLGVMDTGQALAQPLSEPVLTPSGWASMGDLRPGDQVIGVDGKPTDILGVYPQGEKPIYRVEFSDGSFTRCTGDHLWLTRTQYQRNAAAKYAKRNPGADTSQYWHVSTTDEIATSITCTSTGSKNHEVPIADPVMFDSRPVDVDPYLLGFLLGDGHLRQTSVNFTTADQWIVDHIATTVADLALSVRKNPHVRKDGQPNYDYSISAGPAGRTGRGHESNAVLRAIRRYGLIGKRAWEKFVPDDYLHNSPDVRLALLQGLMDADGTIATDGRNRTTKLCTTSRQLSDDALFIARSLGGTASVRERAGRKPNGDPGRPQYLVTLRLPNGTVPFRLPRKADLVRDREKYPPRRYITAVIPDGVESAQCIAVDHPERLYLTRDCVVTHNTRFFQRDSTKANNLTLYPHKQREFYLWLASWAAFVQSPADLGHDPTGYELPERRIVTHEVAVDMTDEHVDRDGQGGLFRSAALGLKEAAAEKRMSMPARIDNLMEIVHQHRAENPGDQVIIWCDLNDEQDAIEQALAAEAITFSSVRGALDPDEVERRLAEWKNRGTYALIGKPVMLGQGMNLQQCNTAIFVGVTYKFNDVIQAVHRIHRFGQTRTTYTHLIYANTEAEVIATIREKWTLHDDLTGTMTDIIREHGLDPAAVVKELTRSMGIERVEASGVGWLVANNDCVLETRAMDDNSVDLIVTSIPFSNHYEYTPSYNDFGHTDDNEHFWAQMDFLTPELLRILAPGRIYACHVKDRILFGAVTGAGVPTVSPFHAEALQHGIKHGFDYLGMITVVTDVVRENNQTYRLGWSEMAKDGTKMGVGSPEYILLFHKPQTDRTKGYADTPVTHDKTEYTRARWQVDAHAFWRSNGDRPLTSDELAALPVEQRSKLFTEQTMRRVYDYESHIKIGETLEGRGALPAKFMSLAPGSWHPEVWTDINRMLTLNGDQKRRNLAMHVCPLQFDIVDRLIERYSNPGDLVFDPFGGLFTVPMRALLKDRRGRAVELNPGYFLDGVKHLEATERNQSMPGLFDLADESAAS